MAIIQAASTVDVLKGRIDLSDSALHVPHTEEAWFDPLGWIVRLTEAAQNRLARAALAQQLAGAPWPQSGSFSNDAAGGGCRATEAARSLRGRAELQ
jgi:hypothetical protein